MATSPDGEACRSPVRWRFGKFNWHLLCGLVPAAPGLCRRPGRGLGLAFGCASIVASSWECCSPKQGCCQLRNCRIPVTPWAVMGGCAFLVHTLRLEDQTDLYWSATVDSSLGVAMSSWVGLSFLFAPAEEEEGKPGRPEGRESCSGPSLS